MIRLGQIKRERSNAKREYNKAWAEYTGRYNKNAKIAIVVSFVICLTPLGQLGASLLFAFFAWLAIDASKKTKRYKEYLKGDRS